MIIHLDGTAEELLEFVKGMQFPIAAGFADLEDDRAETEREVAEEIEKSFGAKEMPLGEWVKKEEHQYEVSIQPPPKMMMYLTMKAARERKTVRGVIIDIILQKMQQEGQ